MLWRCLDLMSSIKLLSHPYYLVLPRFILVQRDAELMDTCAHNIIDVTCWKILFNLIDVWYWQWVNSQHIAVSEYDVIPGDRRQIARLLSVSAEHFYIASQWKSVVQFRSSIAKSKDTLYIVHTYIHDYGDRKGVKRWTQAGQYSCQGCWHSSRNDWAGLWQYSPDNINGPLYETGKYEMGVITVSPVYLHLLAWLTSDHRGKKPADMAGHQRGGGGEGGPSPKMQTSQMPKQKIDLCTPYKLVQSLPFCETQKQPVDQKLN